MIDSNSPINWRNSKLHIRTPFEKETTIGEEEKEEEEEEEEEEKRIGVGREQEKKEPIACVPYLGFRDVSSAGYSQQVVPLAG